MEFSQLKYFKALAETGNLTRTSEKLHLSAPALSTAIGKLESELGCTLFDRVSGKSLVLNDRGRLLLAAYNEVADTLHNATRAIQEMSCSDTGRLAVATASPMLYQDCFISFRQHFPAVCLFHTHLDLQHLHDLEMVKRYDFIIATPQDMSPIAADLQHEVLYSKDPPMLMVYPEHKFANQKSVKVAELDGEPFIALNNNLSSRWMFDELFRIAGIKPKIIFETDHFVRERMILECQGIGLSTNQVRLANLQSRLVFVALEDPNLLRRQDLWWYKRRTLSTIAEAFLKFAPKYYQRINLAQDKTTSLKL